MEFILSNANVFAYLVSRDLCTQEEANSKVEQKSAKNFNLLVSLSAGRKLLVKQEPFTGQQEVANEFLREWRIHEFIQRFPELGYISAWLPEVIHFDAENSIIVINYLTNYRDLAEFYAQENNFAPAISGAIGSALATIHRATLNCQKYQEFFVQNTAIETDQELQLTEGLNRIGPEIFGQVPDDGLKFFALYQRYDSLGQAIAQLGHAYQPCCLTHNDLKLNNILLPLDWENHLQIRLIDWERSDWGDPAFDLGSLIASYLLVWLTSLVVSKSIGIEEALRLAMTPLEDLQPSLVALMRSYCDRFPEIFELHPDFLPRVMQFTGLNLIKAIQSMLQYQKSFGNTGICLLQVAKTLLCRPEASIRIIFGREESELTRLVRSA
ncbi:aminoglycoside phosphotransferase family protein [Gloeocapsopsis crepidinum LEGE 06123]|uniref:Aminoglycoside phosphotransferase family protein n=1 Tax=Gloeocapsopsis crepidinum LEGE 06123 TaxID=588587 RepID=A0ABR9UUM9_9CHRO|nr:phosphotransferase [Gloeocapsopsis crepidinum]MBE9191996.1 aminoglycoside phosphotransferase family protein [Gloeocapsopsis crepidinum LEGE 06123]